MSDDKIMHDNPAEKKILTKLLGSRFVKIQWCEDAPHLEERRREWDDDGGDDDDDDNEGYYNVIHTVLMMMMLIK